MGGLSPPQDPSCGAILGTRGDPRRTHACVPECVWASSRWRGAGFATGPMCTKAGKWDARPAHFSYHGPLASSGASLGWGGSLSGPWGVQLPVLPLFALLLKLGAFHSFGTQGPVLSWL